MLVKPTCVRLVLETRRSGRNKATRPNQGDQAQTRRPGQIKATRPKQGDQAESRRPGPNKVTRPIQGDQAESRRPGPNKATRPKQGDQAQTRRPGGNLQFYPPASKGIPVDLVFHLPYGRLQSPVLNSPQDTTRRCCATLLPKLPMLNLQQQTLW